MVGHGALQRGAVRPDVDIDLDAAAQPEARACQGVSLSQPEPVLAVGGPWLDAPGWVDTCTAWTNPVPAFDDSAPVGAASALQVPACIMDERLPLSDRQA